MPQPLTVWITANCGKFCPTAWQDEALARDGVSRIMKVKEKREKAGLKLNIQKTKIMATSPTTSWQIDGKQQKQ